MFRLRHWHKRDKRGNKGKDRKGGKSIQKTRMAMEEQQEGENRDNFLKKNSLNKNNGGDIDKDGSGRQHVDGGMLWSSWDSFCSIEYYYDQQL